MEIKKATFIMSVGSVDKCPETHLPEYAFIGRSNVGKSSLINMLVAQKGLAMTSSTPGKTKTINYFDVDEAWFIVDLPGYGYAKISKTEREVLRKRIEGYLLKRENLTLVFLLIDSRLEPQKIDLEFINWMGEKGIPFAVVFTKTDKISFSKIKENIAAYKQKLLESWDELPLMFATSSSNKKGREELLEYIHSVNESI